MEKVKALAEQILTGEGNEEDVYTLANATLILVDVVGSVTQFGESLPHHVRKAMGPPTVQLDRLLTVPVEPVEEVEEEVEEEEVDDQNDNPEVEEEKSKDENPEVEESQDSDEKNDDGEDRLIDKVFNSN